MSLNHTTIMSRHPGPFKMIYLQWEPHISAFLIIVCSPARLSRSAEERAGQSRAEAAPTERSDKQLAGQYPEPAYFVEFAYPELQTPQDASASSSSILPSQDRYRGVWCVNCDLFDATGLSRHLTERRLIWQGRPRTVAHRPPRTGTHALHLPSNKP